MVSILLFRPVGEGMAWGGKRWDGRYMYLGT